MTKEKENLINIIQNIDDEKLLKGLKYLMVGYLNAKKSRD